VATDRSGRWLLAAAYMQPGHCCVLAVGPDGCAVGRSGINLKFTGLTQNLGQLLSL
jgi:hypothetical protein